MPAAGWLTLVATEARPEYGTENGELLPNTLLPSKKWPEADTGHPFLGLTWRAQGMAQSNPHFSQGDWPGEGTVTPVLTSPLTVKLPPTLDGQG